MICLNCLQAVDLSKATYGLHPACFTAWFNTSSSAEFKSLTRRSGSLPDQVTHLSSRNNSFFQGKFKKYSAELDGASYILKMREAEAPELPEVEYLCNQIGRHLEVLVAEFYFIDFYGDRVFVTKNFIRPSGAPTDLQHIHHFRKDDQHNCESLVNVIAEQTKRPYDVNRFIKSTLFDALIGNNDRHGKNLGLIVSSRETTLSPSYDNVSYLSLEKGEMLKADFNPTGKISTKLTSEPSMRDYIKEFKRLGYLEQIKEFHHKINLSKINNLIEHSFCSELMKLAIRKLITKRYKELDDEIKN